jgi:DNA-binding NtrC family response regulator
MPASILLADDEQGFRSLFGWQLAAAGFHVITVPDGRQAMDVFAERPCDLVITDLTMPALQGMPLLRFVKDCAPQTPVIVITGFGTVETAVEAMKRGACDFLLKPFRLAHLLNAVVEALGKTPPDSPKPSGRPEPPSP